MDKIREQMKDMLELSFHQKTKKQCNCLADCYNTMEAMLKVVEIAKQLPRFEDTMPSLDDPKLLVLDKALDEALANLKGEAT